jgi:hypothetical protein
MTDIDRRGFLLASSASLIASLFELPAWAAGNPALTRVHPLWVVDEEEALIWHRLKDEKGPALTGNPSWHQFLGFLESKLKDYGCVDVHRSSWNFDRLESSIWPDDSGWSLVSNGQQMKVSNFGANCGLTGPEGVTAELVLWDPESKPDVAGRIIVFRPVPRPEVREPFSNSDYEYMTPFDSWPVEGKPVPQEEPATRSVAAAVWDEMTSSSQFVRDLADAKPAGLVFAMNLNAAATAGLYTFRVPDHYGFPSVYLDRNNGDAVIGDALAGYKATLRVQGRHVPSEAYQLIAYLPGRDYGTDRDEQIHLRTHTDGPSISQDNGALGLLAVVKYMSNIPRKDRPRSLFVDLDCRHFMPGAETTWASQDYFAKFPLARDKVTAMIAMEHLGQIEYAMAGEELQPTGRSLPTWIYAATNQQVIDYARQAARDNRLPSAIIRSPGRLGVHRKSQGPWYGMGREAHYLGLPAYAVQGDLGAYWAFSARVDRFDPRAFRRQVATFCQLTGFLMVSDLRSLQAPRIERQPSDIRR